MGVNCGEEPINFQSSYIKNRRLFDQVIQEECSPLILNSSN